MTKLTLIAAALLVFVSLYATTAARTDRQSPSGQCLTRADVLAHLERSRQGISLTCNEQIRQRNANVSLND